MLGFCRAGSRFRPSIFLQIFVWIMAALACLDEAAHIEIDVGKWSVNKIYLETDQLNHGKQKIRIEVPISNHHGSIESKFTVLHIKNVNSNENGLKDVVKISDPNSGAMRLFHPPPSSLPTESIKIILAKSKSSVTILIKLHYLQTNNLYDFKEFALNLKSGKEETRSAHFYASNVVGFSSDLQKKLNAIQEIQVIGPNKDVVSLFAKKHELKMEFPRGMSHAYARIKFDRKHFTARLIPPATHHDALFTVRIHISDEDFNRLATSQSFLKNVQLESYENQGNNQITYGLVRKENNAIFGPQYHLIVLQKGKPVNSKPMSVKFSHKFKQNGKDGGETFVCEIKKSGDLCAIPFGAVNAHLVWIKIDKSIFANLEEKKLAVQLKLENVLFTQFGYLANSNQLMRKSTDNSPQDGTSGHNKSKEPTLKQQQVDQNTANQNPSTQNPANKNTVNIRGYLSVYPGTRYPVTKPKISLFVQGKWVGWAFMERNQHHTSGLKQKIDYFVVLRRPTVFEKTKSIDLRIGGRVLDYRSLLLQLGNAKHYRKNQNYMYHYLARIYLLEPDVKDFIVRLQTHKLDNASNTRKGRRFWGKRKNKHQFSPAKKNSDPLGEVSEIFYFRTIFPPDHKLGDAGDSGVSKSSPSQTTKKEATPSVQGKTSKPKPAAAETEKKSSKTSPEHAEGGAGDLKKSGKSGNEASSESKSSNDAGKPTKGSGGASNSLATAGTTKETSEKKKGEGEPKGKKDESSNEAKDAKSKDSLVKPAFDINGSVRRIRFYSGKIFLPNLDEVVVVHSKDASFKQGLPVKWSGIWIQDLDEKDPNRKQRRIPHSSEQQTMYHATFQVSSALRKQELLNVQIRYSGMSEVVPAEVVKTEPLAEVKFRARTNLLKNKVSVELHRYVGHNDLSRDVHAKMEKLQEEGAASGKGADDEKGEKSKSKT